MIEANQELPSWLEAMGIDSRNHNGGRRSGGGKSRFGGTGFGAKDVRVENGSLSNGATKIRTQDRGRMYGGWSGPPGLRSDGGNYASGAGGPDWWDS